jgi:neutral amino acid transport system ATP-binding protein
LTADPFLSIRAVRKRFGGVTALDGVSLEVPAGAVFGLIGPNGSGKTTLFNVVTGFLRPDAGAVFFEGRQVTGQKPHRVARLGLCRTFQASACPQRLTVMENMLLAAREQAGESLLALLVRRGQVRAEERQNISRARELLAIVNLSAKTDEYAGSLSGGQRKLLSLAQALMAEPKLILLDEPVAGVNPVLAEEIAVVIRRLRTEGRNFLIVEHNMKFIRETCERVAVLDSGRVMAEGTPADVLAREDVLRAYLARPADQRAAS